MEKTMEKKSWKVTYSQKDGRKATVEVSTEIAKSEGFRYGNGKAGLLVIDDFAQAYDLRYNTEKDLHLLMLKDYFGERIMEAIEI